MTTSGIASIMTALFTGSVACITLYNHFKSKIICSYERVDSCDEGDETIDHCYIIFIKNNSEINIRIKYMCSYGCTNFLRKNFHEKVLKPGEQMECGCSFYAKNSSEIYFKVKLVKINKESLPVYQIEVVQHVSILKKWHTKIAELKEWLQ